MTWLGEKSWWPTARAVLIVLHLLAIFILALPSGSPLGAEEYWAASSEVPEQEASESEPGVWNRVLGMREDIVGPFAYYADVAGTRQGWAMFANPLRKSGRVKVEVEREGRWQPAFLTEGEQADWDLSLIHI